MKIESPREVKNNFSEVIEALSRTGPVVVTKNGRSAALLLPIDENTDLESLILSNSPRFWKLFDNAASGRRTPLHKLPDRRRESMEETSCPDTEVMTGTGLGPSRSSGRGLIRS